MDTILNKLLEAFYSGILTQEQMELRKKLAPMIAPAEEKLTRKEFEDFWSAVETLKGEDGEDLFSLGFRLGVQLTLSGLEPVK